MWDRLGLLLNIQKYAIMIKFCQSFIGLFGHDVLKVRFNEKNSNSSDINFSFLFCRMLLEF